MIDRDAIQLFNIRRRRAEGLTASLMREIEEELPEILASFPYARQQLHDMLFIALHRNGAAWTTDEEREKLGFNPRDPAGWTLSERAEHKMEVQRAMMTLQAPVIYGRKPDGD